MSNDKYSHLGLALAAILLAGATFAAGYYNGTGLTSQSQTAAVMKAVQPSAVMKSAATTNISPDEIAKLKVLLNGFNVSKDLSSGSANLQLNSRKNECDSLIEAAANALHAADACDARWEAKCGPDVPQDQLPSRKVCKALSDACGRMRDLSHNLFDIYEDCISEPVIAL